MRRIILIGALVITLICGISFEVCAASIEIKGIDKKTVMDVSTKAMLEAGFNIMSVNDYQIIFKADSKNPTHQIFFGTRFNVVPEIRIFLNFIQIEQTVTITGESKIVSNPNSAFEKSTSFKPDDIVPYLNYIKEKFYGSIMFGLSFSNKKVKKCYEVLRVWKNSSVEKAGIEVGDLVKEVNGEPVKKMNFKEFDLLFDVPEGTKIDLIIIKKSGEEKQVTIEKAFVPGEYQYLLKQ